MQQRASQPTAQEAHHTSAPAHSAGTHLPQAGAESRAADPSAMSQQGSASPQHAQQAQQAMAQMSAPLSLPPSMVRIAAALPPMQQQVMVRSAFKMCLKVFALTSKHVWHFTLFGSAFLTGPRTVLHGSRLVLLNKQVWLHQYAGGSN